MGIKSLAPVAAMDKSSKRIKSFAHVAGWDNFIKRTKSVVPVAAMDKPSERTKRFAYVPTIDKSPKRTKSFAHAAAKVIDKSSNAKLKFAHETTKSASLAVADSVRMQNRQVYLSDRALERHVNAMEELDDHFADLCVDYFKFLQYRTIRFSCNSDDTNLELPRERFRSSGELCRRSFIPAQ